jgi:glyoxylase-like metal-dependent hydrolase (beta-lactamase superfamily II)
MGDHFFNGTFPYFDNDGGGDIKGYAANIERLLGEIPPDAKIIPGHGPLATVEDLRKFHKMMVETTAIVEAGVKAGKNARKMKSEKVLAAYSSWGKGFLNEDAYIDLLYKDLTRKK